MSLRLIDEKADEATSEENDTENFEFYQHTCRNNNEGQLRLFRKYRKE